MTQHVKLIHRDKHAVLNFHDLRSIDANSAHRIKAEVKGLLREDTKHLFIDLEGISFIDSTGFGALISILKTIKGQDGHMLLFNVSEEIAELMDLMQLTTVFEVKRNLAEAEASIK